MASYDSERVNNLLISFAVFLAPVSAFSLPQVFVFPGNTRFYMNVFYLSFLQKIYYCPSEIKILSK